MKSKAHLFPHSYLPPSVLNKLIYFIGPVRNYQPWFLETADSLINLDKINPPENLKPKADIKAILSGYRLWTGQNRDRGSREFLKFSKKTYKDDDSTWEIKRHLKAAADPSLASKEEESTLKWHVILHLAHEVERQNFEIRDMMDSLKKRRPVLAGALQEPDEAKGFLDDTLGLEPIDNQDTLNIGLILDAWFGLFNGYIEKDAVLITCNSHVMDYISSLWEDEFAGKDAASPQTLSFKLPQPVWFEHEPDDRTRKDIHETMMKMRELILGSEEDPALKMNELKALAREFEKMLPEGMPEEMSSITMKYFPSTALHESFDSMNFLRHIAGKIIISATSG
jgi:hypothetical protein